MNYIHLRPFGIGINHVLFSDMTGEKTKAYMLGLSIICHTHCTRNVRVMHHFDATAAHFMIMENLYMAMYGFRIKSVLVSYEPS